MFARVSSSNWFCRVSALAKCSLRCRAQIGFAVCRLWLNVRSGVDWAEKYFSAQSAWRSSGVTLSPSYTKYFPSSFQKKYSTTPRKSQALTWGLGSNTLPSIFSANLPKVYLLFFIANERDFYTVVFGCGES